MAHAVAWQSAIGSHGLFTMNLSHQLNQTSKEVKSPQLFQVPLALRGSAATPSSHRKVLRKNVLHKPRSSFATSSVLGVGSISGCHTQMLFGDGVSSFELLQLKKAVNRTRSQRAVRQVKCSSVNSSGAESSNPSVGSGASTHAHNQVGRVQGGQGPDRPMILPVLLREKTPEHFVKAAEGLLKMARLHNYFPSLLLVFLGAWMASGRDSAVLLMPRVWITAVCSALIAVASMLANDVFDFRSGTDQANERDTPLMTGEVDPDDAELAAGCLYGAAVIGICCLEPMNLRLLVGGAAVATYIYTPFLKRLLVVKNVIVAAIIASSILAGGLVAGGTAGVARTGQVSLFFFLCILCREILMDVGDMVGDKAAGVRTVAVCFGRRFGTVAAGMSLAAANAVLIGLLSRTRAFAAAGTLLLLPLHAKIFQLVQGGTDFTADRLSSLRTVVDQSMLYIGGTVILLATSL